MPSCSIREIIVKILCRWRQPCIASTTEHSGYEMECGKPLLLVKITLQAAPNPKTKQITRSYADHSLLTTVSSQGNYSEHQPASQGPQS